MSFRGDSPRLPHGPPFLLLDRVVEVRGRSGVFVKLVSGADPCVVDGGRLPAAFVLEAMAQGCGALVASQEPDGASGGYLAAVDDFRMLAEVRVGDELRIEAEIVRTFSGAIACRARAAVGEETRAEARVTLKPPR